MLVQPLKRLASLRVLGITNPVNLALLNASSPTTTVLVAGIVKVPLILAP